MEKIYGEIGVKSQDSKSVVIEGFANKAIVDRGNDLIPPSAWKLDEYKRNPIVFFNHDRNVPIGKALDLQITPDGLKVKAQISKSDAAPMPFIRDMIKERILRTFSVGFDPMDSIEKRSDGVNIINKANLLEFSVVSIPMNQESDFDLIKRVPSWKTKSYDDAVADVLRHKGSMVASELHHMLGMAQARVEGFDKKEALGKIANLSNLSMQQVLDILAGVITPVPESFLKAFSQVFVVPTDYLQFLAREESSMIENESVERKAASEISTKGDMEEDDDKGGMDEEEDEKGDDEEDEEEEMDSTAKLLAGEQVPKELAIKLSALLRERDKQENPTALYACILLTDFMVVGKEKAICKEEAVESLALLLDFIHIKDFVEEVADVIASEAGFDSEETEEASNREEEEKQADQEEGLEPTPTVPVSDKTDDETEFGNPHLTVAKSHLAMAGSMVSELKSMNSILGEVKGLLSDVLNMKADAPMPSDEEEAEEQAEDVQDEEEDVKLRMLRLDRKLKIIQNFRKRIESL